MTYVVTVWPPGEYSALLLITQRLSQPLSGDVNACSEWAGIQAKAYEDNGTKRRRKYY